jgi:hypothetical protein
LDAGCLYSATNLFNLGNDTVEAGSREAGDITDELRRRCDLRDCALPTSIHDSWSGTKSRPPTADVARGLIPCLCCEGEAPYSCAG